MPTPEDYDTAAAELAAAAQVAGTLAERPRADMGTGVMVGGQLTDLVTGELDAAATILDEVTVELTRLAETCREHAEEARQVLATQQGYDAAYAAYETELRQWQDEDRDGPPPEPPSPV